MGTQCSCIAESHVQHEATLFSGGHRKSNSNSLTTVNQSLNATSVPLTKSNGDLNIKIENEIDDLFELENDAKPSLDLAVQKDSLVKKRTSLLRFDSLQSKEHVDLVEYSSGDDWKMQNIRLESLIQKSPGKYLWEASNITTGKKCAVKISLVEAPRQVSNNFTKTEALLKDLSEIKNPHVVDIYSFSVFESEFHQKPYLVVVSVQELVKCSLRDIDMYKREKEILWNQAQILIIIRDIYAGLIACREKQIVHGRLVMENVLLSKDEDRILLADFAMKLPFSAESRTTSLTPKYNFSQCDSIMTEKTLSAPDDKDVIDLTKLALKLITADENIGFQYNRLRKDERYRRAYREVFEALDIITGKEKNADNVLRDLTRKIQRNSQKLDLDLPVNFDNKCEQETYADLLFLKIDCYEILNRHDITLELYSELVKILENKNKKGKKEYQEYIKCINKTIEHYLSLNDWLKAKTIGAELQTLLKKDEAIKKILKSDPKEYINFTFLLGYISEGLNEHEKAIVLYKKAISYCLGKNLMVEAYPSALKRIFNILITRNEGVQALESLKKLLDYYENQEGLYLDKADGYLNMGDILTQQGNFGQGVKFYLRSLDNLKKVKVVSNELLLSLMDKIVLNYKKLHEDDNTLRYMFDSLELKKEMFGKDSQEYINQVFEIAAVQARLGNYREALNYYLSIQKSFTDKDLKNDQYAESIFCMGDIYFKMQQYEKAKSSFKSYAELQKELKGGIKGKEYLKAQDKLATILFEENMFEDAIQIQINSFEVKEQLFKADDLYMILSLCNIGDTYFANGWYDRAVEFHEDSLSRLKNRREELREEYSQLLLKIALDYEKAKNCGQALTSVYHSFHIRKREGPESDLENTIKMYDFLGQSREKKKKSLDFSNLAGSHRLKN